MPSTIASRSESEAFRKYAVPLQRVIAAFPENTFLQRTGFNVRAGADSLQLAGRTAMQLRDAEHQPRLLLAADLLYRAVRLEGVATRWAVRTLGYAYELTEASGPGRPMVSYHWHPHVPGVPFPHVHLPSAPSEQSRLHVVVPHCTLRHVLTFAVRDLGVHPIRDQWRRVLDEAHAVLEASMEWAHYESFSLSD